MKKVEFFQNVIPREVVSEIPDHYERVMDKIPRVDSNISSIVEEYDRFAYVKKHSYFLATPKLQAAVRELLPNHDFLCESYFESKPNQKLITWHTGLTQAMAVKNAAMLTLWFPLSGSSLEDGGLVQFYNGPLADEIDKFLRLSLEHHAIHMVDFLMSMKGHLEKHSFVPDVKVGDCVIFDEGLPHKAVPCKNHRQAYSLRMVPKGWQVNEAWVRSKIGKETSYTAQGLYQIALDEEFG